MPTGVFDRVVIKSGNHEIPLAQQHTLYHQCFALLKPGGLSVNLGLVFDDGAEREEFAAFVRVKDQMVGLESAVQQHHFLTRDELYPRIRQVGFVDVHCQMVLAYTMRSWVLTQVYVPRTPKPMPPCKRSRPRPCSCVATSVSTSRARRVRSRRQPRSRWHAVRRKPR